MKAELTGIAGAVAKAQPGGAPRRHGSDRPNKVLRVGSTWALAQSQTRIDERNGSLLSTKLKGLIGPTVCPVYPFKDIDLENGVLSAHVPASMQARRRPMW